MAATSVCHAVRGYRSNRRWSTAAVATHETRWTTSPVRDWSIAARRPLARHCSNGTPHTKRAIRVRSAAGRHCEVLFVSHRMEFREEGGVLHDLFASWLSQPVRALVHWLRSRLSCCAMGRCTALAQESATRWTVHMPAKEQRPTNQVNHGAITAVILRRLKSRRDNNRTNALRDIIPKGRY